MIPDEAVIKMIVEQATLQKIDPNLAIAIAYAESRLDTTRVKYESKWHRFVTPEVYSKHLGIDTITETTLQSFSWGIFQVIGSVARELLYNGSLTLLIQPSLGILYGCKKIKDLVKQYNNELDVISSYNQGSPIKANGVYRNQKYVNEVSAKLAELRGKK